MRGKIEEKEVFLKNSAESRLVGGRESTENVEATASNLAGKIRKLVAPVTQCIDTSLGGGVAAYRKTLV